jgi:uncharacterized protein YcbK (DUF882 family)
MSETLDWSRWPNFSEAEFRCKCGACGGSIVMEPAFLDKLQAVRDAVGFPMPVTSGYRCSAHPEERKKKGGPGAHHHGVAADIACDGRGAILLEMAFVKVQEAAGDKRIGLGRSQRPGVARFVHLDCHDDPARPNAWSY